MGLEMSAALKCTHFSDAFVLVLFALMFIYWRYETIVAKLIQYTTVILANKVFL
jgi:hypothetical protein